MSGTTISGTHLSPVTLSNAATQNPATVASGATISAPSGTALAGSSGTYWTIVNDGLVEGVTGISLASGGTVTDAGGGSVTGSSYGIVLGHGGSVHNGQGSTIQGDHQAVRIVGGTGTILNSGSIVATGATYSRAAYLGSGGYISNSSAGEIVGERYGAVIGGGTGIFVNAGLITVESALTSTAGSAVVLKQDGSVANLAGGSILGGKYGVSIYGYIPGGKLGNPTFLGGTVTNLGTIGSDEVGVGLRAGYVFNATDAYIFGGVGVRILATDATVVNAGTILGESNFGVYLESGGYVSNASGGSISSNGTAIDFNGHNGNRLVNYGTVTGANGVLLTGGYVTNGAGGYIGGVGSGVKFVNGAGVLINSGAITASSHNSAGVDLEAGGFVTNTASGTIAGSGFGIQFNGPGIAALLNSGSISAGGTNSGTGVEMTAGGSVSNSGPGSITGGSFGIFIFGGSGTVVNSGAIAGTLVGSSLNGDGVGVDLDQAGSIANTASGSITGVGRGIVAMYSTGTTTVVNSGSIAGDLGEGIYLLGAARVTNAAGGTISGDAIGVRLEHGGTVTNAGTITDSVSGKPIAGKAIAFYGTLAGRVVVDASAVFHGDVVGSASASNTLELASSASTGTISGIGSKYINFGTVTVDKGANWELAGTNSLTSGSTLRNNGTLTLSGATLADAGIVINNGKIELDPSSMTVASLTGTGTVKIDAGSTLSVEGIVSSGQDIIFSGSGAGLDLASPSNFGGTLTGFANGDKIDLTSVALVGKSHAYMNDATNVLTVTVGSATYHFQFDKSENFSGDFFHLASAHGGTMITEDQVACYGRGTRIATRSGETPVEELSIGDEIMTASGKLRPIKWIGRRSYGGRFIVGRKDILPVCFKAGSLGDGLPRRDLWISPHHAMYLDGVLIEARDLVNGISIVQADEVESVEYFHVELDSHDVILAEGAPSETFVDDDSRGMFHNAQEYALLYPDEASPPTRYCAPRLDEGFEVEAIRRRLAQRAGLLPVQQHAQAGKLRGYIDAASTAAIEGWAQDIDHPDAPVCLDFYADGRLIGRTLANRYREDLAAAGIGDGRHSFVFVPPDGMRLAAGSVEVVRTLDGMRPAQWDGIHAAAALSSRRHH